MQGLAHLDNESRRGTQRSDANRLSPVGAVEEHVLAGRHRRRRRQVDGSIDNLVIGRTDLEHDLVDFVVDEGVQCFARQIDAGRACFDPDVVRDIEYRIEQGTVVGIGDGVQRYPVGDERTAGNHEQ